MASVTTSFLVEEDRAGKGRGRGKGGKGSGSRSTQGKGGKGGKGAQDEKRASASAVSAAPATDAGPSREAAAPPRRSDAPTEESKAAHGAEAGLKNPRVGRKKAANKKTGPAAAPASDVKGGARTKLKAKQTGKSDDKKVVPPQPVSLQAELLQSICAFAAPDANTTATFEEIIARVVAAPNKDSILSQAEPLPWTVTVQAPSLLDGGKKATPLYVAASVDAPIAVLERLLAAGAVDRWSRSPGTSALVAAAARGKAHAVALMVSSAPPFGSQQAQTSEGKSASKPLSAPAEKELVMAAAAVLAAPSLKDELLVLDLLRLIAHALARGRRQLGRQPHYAHQPEIAREPSLRLLFDRVATQMQQGTPPLYAKYLETFHAASLCHMLVLRRWPTLLFAALRPFLGTAILGSTAMSPPNLNMAKLEDYLQPASDASLHSQVSVLQFAEVELAQWRAPGGHDLWSAASSECYETESDCDESRSSSNSGSSSGSSRDRDNCSQGSEDNESGTETEDDSERSVPRRTTHDGQNSRGGKGGRGRGKGGRGFGGRGGRGFGEGRGLGGRMSSGLPHMPRMPEMPFMNGMPEMPFVRRTLEQRPEPKETAVLSVPEQPKMLLILGSYPEAPTSEECVAAVDALWLCMLVMAEAMGLCASVDGGRALQIDRTKREVLAVFGLERVMQALAEMDPKDQGLSRTNIIGDVSFMHQHAQAHRVNQSSWSKQLSSSSGPRDLACWHTLVRPLADQSLALASPMKSEANKDLGTEELEEAWCSHWKRLFAQQGSEAWEARLSHVLEGSRAPAPHIVPVHPIHAAIMKPKPVPPAAGASADSADAVDAAAAPLSKPREVSEEIIDSITTGKGKGRGKGKGNKRGKGRGGKGGKGGGKDQGKDPTDVGGGFKPYPYEHSLSTTLKQEAQNDNDSSSATAHFALTSSSVEFILKVLCDNAATPVVLLSWVYILAELCSGYGPSLLDNSSASTGRNRKGGINKNNDRSSGGGESTALRALRENHFECLGRPSMWRHLTALISHVGFVLLFGATGQHESKDGDVLQERERELFDSLWELILRLLPPYAAKLALNFTSENGSGGGGSSCSSANGNRAAAAAEQAGLEDTVRALSPILSPLWSGLRHALMVLEGNVYLMPERFGSLLRAYYVWTALAASPADYKEANTASASTAVSMAAGSSTKTNNNKRSSSAAEEIAALLRACAQPPPLERLSAARRGRSRLWTLFASALRTATSGTTGVGRSGNRFTGLVCRVPNRGGGGGGGGGYKTNRGGGAKHPLEDWPGLPLSSDLLNLLADPLVKRGVNALVATETDLLRGELAFALRVPGLVSTKHKVSLVEQELTALSTGRILDLALNRMSVSLPGQLNATAQQLVAAPAEALATGELSVGFEDEEGVGAGPVREFLDVAASLFKPLTGQEAALANHKKADARLLEAGSVLVGAFVRAPGDSSGLAVVPRPPAARPLPPPGLELVAAEVEKEVNLIMENRTAALELHPSAASGGGGGRRGPRGGNARHHRSDLWMGMSEELQHGMLRLRAMTEACQKSLREAENPATAAAASSEPTGISTPSTEPSGSTEAPSGESSSTPPQPETVAPPPGVAEGSGKGKGRQRWRGGGKGGGKGKNKGGAAATRSATTASTTEGRDEGSLASMMGSLNYSELGLLVDYANVLGNWSTSEALATRDALACGRLLGLSIKAGTPLGVLLPLALWNELLAEDGVDIIAAPQVPPELDWEAYCLDDEAFARGLRQLLEMPPDQVDDLGLTFAVTEVETSSEEKAPGASGGTKQDSSPNGKNGGKGKGKRTNKEALAASGGGAAVGEGAATASTPATTTEVDLLPGGSSLAVTSSNARNYVYLAARRKLFRGADRRIRLLKQGLRDVMPPNLLAMFTPTELQSIVSGPLTIDVDAWRQATLHKRGLNHNHPVAQWFWEEVRAMSEADRRKLLLFWSASSIAPLFGFGGTTPGGGVADDDEAWQLERMSKYDMAHGATIDHWFPEASTCDRTLRLPAYTSKAALARNLALALDLGGVGYDRA